MATPPATPGYQALKDRSCVFVGPFEVDGAAALQNNDERLASGGHGFKEFLLRGGQVDAGAVAAVKAGNLDAHLLAFKLRGQAPTNAMTTSDLWRGNGFVKLGLAGASHLRVTPPPARSP